MFHHPIYRVEYFNIIDSYTLKIGFNDNTVQIINFEPILYGKLYGPLRDLTLFNQVKLDPEVHTLVWPNEADFDPATLHNWPEQLPHFLEMVARWQTVNQERSEFVMA
jgi:hypothetical protein